jgi:hypothetical protein
MKVMEWKSMILEVLRDLTVRMIVLGVENAPRTRLIESHNVDIVIKVTLPPT